MHGLPITYLQQRRARVLGAPPAMSLHTARGPAAGGPACNVEACALTALALNSLPLTAHYPATSKCCMFAHVNVSRVSLEFQYECNHSVISLNQPIGFFGTTPSRRLRWELCLTTPISCTCSFYYMVERRSILVHQRCRQQRHHAG